MKVVNVTELPKKVIQTKFSRKHTNNHAIYKINRMTTQALMCKLVLFSAFVIAFTGCSSLQESLRLNGKSKTYLASVSTPLKVRDFISGMTDRYFTSLLRKIMIPEVSLGGIDRV